ncbi:MAG: type II toxin-antitoxin system prevent-host-death family antitoxin [Cyanobacteria bacterium P01_F01_bin.86]
MSLEPTDRVSQTDAQLKQFADWKLEDAKARLSEVVRLARHTEPQRITVRGEDAVVVISTQLFEKMLPLLAQPSLHALLAESPLSKLDFESTSVQSPIRDIEL